MSIDECGFGRAPDGYCTDNLSLEVRAAQANLARKTRERMRQRVAEKTIEIAKIAEQGENDD